MKSTYRDEYAALCFSLSEDERTELMLGYQTVLDGEAPTWSFDRKLERMRVFLMTCGVPITEAEIRSPRRDARA